MENNKMQEFAKRQGLQRKVEENNNPYLVYGLMADYANQRVVEELEKAKLALSKKSFSEHCIEEIDSIIKELKQK